MPLQTYITQPLLPENFYHIYNRGNEKGTAIAFDEDNYYFFLRRWKKYMLSYVDTLAYCILQDHYHIAVRIKPADEVLQAAARHLKVVRKDEWQRLQRKLEMELNVAGELNLAGLPEPEQINLAGFPEDKNSSTSQQNEQDHDDDTVNLTGLLGLGHGHVHVHSVASRKHDIAKLLASHAVSSPRLSHLLDTLPLDMLTGLASWAVSERIRRFHLSYSKAINKQQNRRGSLMQKPFRRKLFKGKNNLKRLIRYIHNNPVHHGYVYDIGDYKWSSYNSFFSKEATSLHREEVISMFGGIKAFEEFHKKKRFDIFGEP